MANLDTDGIWHIVQDGLVYGINVLSAALHSDVLDSLLHVMGHLPWIADYHAYLPFFARSVRRFRAFAIQCATIRFKDGSPYKDLFHYLVRFLTFVVVRHQYLVPQIDEEGVQKQQPSMAEIISDGGLAIVAGSDTTSSALSSLFWCLLRHPEAYACLRAEVDALGPDDLRDTTRHTQMPYLNAVMYVFSLSQALHSSIHVAETKHSACFHLCSAVASEPQYLGAADKPLDPS